MRRLIVMFISLLFLAGCGSCAPSGPESSVSPTPVETAEPSPSPTPEPEASATPGVDAGRAHITTPVLIEGFLAGGLIGGEWKYYDDFYKSEAVDFDGFVYDVYVDDAYVGEAAGGIPLDYLTGEPVMPDDDLSSLADVKLKDENQQKVSYEIALKGDWELFPRGYESQNTDQPEYQSVAEGLLTEEGLADPVTALKQVIEADLDGDGTNEVLFSADNMEGEQFGSTKKGDNSLLVLRRVIDGQQVDRIVDSYIVKKEPDYNTIYRLLYEVLTCADLDGDGMLEVVVKSRHYEGKTYSVYKLEGDRLKLVAAKGVGL